MQTFTNRGAIALLAAAVGCAQDTAYGSYECNPAETIEACRQDPSVCELLEGGWPACDEARSDGSSGIPDWWYERTEACYVAEDYGCVNRYFRLLAWGGWLNGLVWASEAMSKYLSCDTEVLEVDPDDVAFNGDFNYYTSYFIDKGVATYNVALADTRAAAMEMARTAPLEIGESATFELPAIFTASGNEDVRKTLGRFYLTSEVEVTRTDAAARTFRLTFNVEDEYDWHPDRVGAGGRSYSQEYPYHLWAAKLKEIGWACDFPMHVGWSEEGSVAP